jgi:hypothetical protein
VIEVTVKYSEKKHWKKLFLRKLILTSIRSIEVTIKRNTLIH